MNLTLVSWNGDTRINDGTNFIGVIVPGSMIDLTRQAVYVDRAENFPYLSGAVLPAHSFTFRIVLPNSNVANFISTQRELLKQIFNILDFTPHALIGKDENNKQWQLTGFCVRLTVDQKVVADTAFFVTLAVNEPVWSSVTVNSDTWNITATGQQHTVTPAGNMFARPTFTITPTLARLTTWNWFRYLAIYNRLAASLNNYPVEVTNGGLNTAALVNNTAVSNQVNQVGGILATDTTIPINTPVGGGLPNSGMGWFADTGEQISWTSNGGGTSLTGVVRGIGGTTPAAHANAAVIAQSKMMANGQDIRVQVDGQFVNQWIDAPNTTVTKIWCDITWGVSRIGTLKTALPNSGTAVTVQFQLTSANLQVLTAMKAARNTSFMIDSEIFTYSPANVNLTLFQITSCQRAQKYTAFAAHSVAASIIWLEHDIFLLYGNLNALALDVDNTQQPLLDLHNSTNTSWVQTQFFDNTSARPGAWSGAVLLTRGKQSSVFTGNQKALANPSTELGCTLLDFMIANQWKSETATIQWLFNHAVGIVTVTMSGQKFVNALGTWPAIAGLQKSTDGLTWLPVWNEAIPTLAATWQSFSHAAVALGATFKQIRLILSGTISALASNEADIQGDTVTLALDSTTTPVFSVGTEQTTGAAYYIQCTITNTTTGDNFTLSVHLPLNTAVVVNTQQKTVTLADGSNALPALTPSTIRNDWLNLQPGANVLQFDDAGTAGVTIVTTWQDRTM